jgi:hypothetical protein
MAEGEGAIYISAEVANATDLYDLYRIDVTGRNPGPPVKINSTGDSSLFVYIQPKS